MNIIVNGEQKECKDGLSISELLNDFEVEKERVAIELNANIIPRAQHSQTILHEKDKLEIVTFVGGG